MRLDWFVPALAAHVAPLADALAIERRLPDARGVAVTFDDGPHPEGTPAVLEVLARHGAHATFFLVGEQVRRYPALAREIATAGHELGVHGDQHTLLLRRRLRDVVADYDRAAAAIADAASVEPTLYRPPYGIFSSGALAEVRARSWRPLLWSAWGRDWERRATPSSIARRATRRLTAGAVVLLHDSDAYSSKDSWRSTAAALPSVLDAIAEIGSAAVRVSTQST